jgi:hypothetical protein
MMSPEQQYGEVAFGIGKATRQATEDGKPKSTTAQTLEKPVDIFDGLTLSQASSDHQNREVSVAIPQQPDTFGLEPAKIEVDPIVKYAEEVFDRTLAFSIKYAAANTNDRRITNRVRETGQTVQLPIIRDESNQSSQLSFAVNTDGSHLIKLEGHTDGNGKQAGFFLTQQSDKSVVIHDANVDRAWTNDDPNYIAVLDQTKRYIKMYFEGLGAIEKAQNLSDAQRKLGLVAVKPEVEVVTMKRETIKYVPNEEGNLVARSRVLGSWHSAVLGDGPAIKDNNSGKLSNEVEENNGSRHISNEKREMALEKAKAAQRGLGNTQQSEVYYGKRKAPIRKAPVRKSKK